MDVWFWFIIFWIRKIYVRLDYLYLLGLYNWYIKVFRISELDLINFIIFILFVLRLINMIVLFIKYGIL